MKLEIYILSVFLASLFACSKQNAFNLLSPNGQLQVVISNRDRSSLFTAIYNGDTLIQQSALGLQVNDISLTNNVSIAGFSKTEFNEN